MRCMTLARAWRDRGADCLFICREHPGNMLAFLREEGFRAHSLLWKDGKHFEYELAHGEWLGTSQEIDGAESLQPIAKFHPDWLIVDHYALDAKWERIVRPHVRELLVIDDLADRHHVCSLLLDQTLGRRAQTYEPFVSSDCKILAGATYALLRPEFASLRSATLARRLSGELNYILITMGGVDRPNATGAILDVLRSFPLPARCEITVVMGAKAPWLEDVRQQARTMTVPTRVLTDIRDMAALMANSDIAIGAAGSTSWERCCLGLPTILLVLADNQRFGATQLAQAGAAYMVGEIRDIANRLPGALSDLIAKDARTHMAAQASKICDGMGVSRVMRMMEPSYDG